MDVVAITRSFLSSGGGFFRRTRRAWRTWLEKRGPTRMYSISLSRSSMRMRERGDL